MVVYGISALPRQAYHISARNKPWYSGTQVLGTEALCDVTFAIDGKLFPAVRLLCAVRPCECSGNTNDIYSSSNAV